jgi:methionyl-tRNA formyltransferase
MRVAFLGNAAWSVPSLEALASSQHELVVVATRTPRPGRRGAGRAPTPVALAARQMDLPVAELDTVISGAGFEALAASRPDVLAVVAYGEILPPSVLGIPRRAPVNLHFSLLPKLRGAAPVQRAILEGLESTGVTTIRMDPGMDTGPVLLQAREDVLPEDDSGSLGGRLATLGGHLLAQTIDRIADGSITEAPQDEALATFAPKLRAEDRSIDWREDAVGVTRRVRAMAPEPGATTVFRGGVLKVLKASPVERHPVGGGGPGGILAASGDDLVVLAGAGAVRLDLVAPQGRRAMSGPEFVRGYRPAAGEVLGGR